MTGRGRRATGNLWVSQRGNELMLKKALWVLELLAVAVIALNVCRMLGWQDKVVRVLGVVILVPAAIYGVYEYFWCPIFKE